MRLPAAITACGVAALVAVLWIMLDPSPPSSPLAVEDERSFRVRQTETWEVEAPSGAPSVPASPQHAGRRTSRPGPAVPAVDGSSPAASAAIEGRAYLPEALRARVRAMQLHVTRWWRTSDGEIMDTRVHTDVFDQAGGYALRRLGAGRFRLQIVLDGHAVSEPVRLKLDPGERATGRDFDFRRRVVYEGRLLDTLSAEPVEGARITVEGEPSVRSDREGRFRLHDLPAGTHQVVVLHPEHAPAEIEIRVPEDRGAVDRGETILEPGAEARVLVADEAGARIPGAALTLSSQRYFVASRTDEDGMAHFRGLMPGERYAVRFTDIHVRAKAAFVVPDPDGIREVTITVGR